MVIIAIINRLLAVVKVKTDIITSIAACLIGLTMILVIMNVKTFKADIIIFIGNMFHFTDR
jgi:hypothetical protein